MSAEFQLSDPTPPRITERHMLDALMTKYDKTIKNGSWVGKRYMRAEHVPIGLSWERHRIADFIAVDTHSYTRDERGYVGHGLYEHQRAPVFHGHEVKVSRSDWLAELRDPSKAETFKRHMHFWWLVVSDRAIVRDDLPDGWGLMVKSGRSVRVVKRAPLLTPEPMPNGLIGAIMRATLATENRAGTADPEVQS